MISLATRRLRFAAPLMAISVAWIASCGVADEANAWKAGVASVAITPRESMWMAGYASRKAPSDGTISELFAKALALEDTNGSRAVIVTTDLISIPRVLRDQVSKALAEKLQLDPAALLLNCSHTHCGPVVKDNLELSVMYRLDAEQTQRIESYFGDLRDKLVGVVTKAINSLQPAKLGYSHARCGFAMNRRLPTKGGYQNSPFPDGPVDHVVPVLRVESPDGKLLSVAFGYACHNTTTALQQFNADYAGFAQTQIEQSHPGAMALFVMGCGGDQNPYPRGQIEWAQTHGKSLAAAVEAALLPQAKTISGPLRCALVEIDVEFEPVSKADLTKRLESNDVYERRGAEALLHEAERLGKVRDRYPYPVQVIQFGNDLTLVALAGEVVVDYALRLKQELSGGNPVWVAGYSNDVFAYIPSVRVLQEGGYEGGGAMRYSALPAPFRPDIEERIITTARETANKLLRPAGKAD